MPPLRIGVNALYLIPGGVGGTEIYLRNLLHALAARDRRNLWYVFTNKETRFDLTPTAGNFVTIPQRVAATNRPARLLWEQTFLPLSAWRLRLDCMLNPGFTAPAINTCPNVTVFHDLQHKRHPEHFKRLDKIAWDAFLGISVRRTRVFLADSEATKSDLMRYYRIPENRIRVALLGVEDEFFSLAEWRGQVQPYVLCVSTLHPHKNIERLLRAFARFRRERPEFRLVLAGMRGFRSSEVEQQIDRSNLREAVRVTGWIPRAELYGLYRQASAFIYPSTFEGFGLPVIEAMAAGIPLACSNIEPLRSIAGDTAVLFEPLDEDDILRALHDVVSGYAKVEAARLRARDYSWSRCAEETVKAIEEATECDRFTQIPGSGGRNSMSMSAE